MEKLLASLFELRDLDKIGDRLRIAYTGHDIFTLGIDKEVPVALVGAICGVTSKSDTCSRGVALIAKDHRLDIHRGAEVVRNFVSRTIDNRAIIHPRTEDCLLSKP